MTNFRPGTIGCALEQENRHELPPREFANAMHAIGRPVGFGFRETPEWKIWLAGRRCENRRMHDELAAAEELICVLEREAED